MKPIRYISIIAILLSINSVFGQRNPLELKDISISRHKSSIDYYRLAEKPLDGNYKTYNVRLDVPAGWTPQMKKAMEDNFFIEGFEKVEGDVADLSIISTVDEFAIGKDSMYASSEKDRYGKIEKVVSVIRVPYSYNYMTLLVNNIKNDTLYVGRRRNEDNYKFVAEDKDEDFNLGFTYSKRKEIYANLPQLVEKEKMKTIAGFSIYYSSRWTIDYGSRKTTEEISFYRIKDSKHYETYFFAAQLHKFGGLPASRTMPATENDRVKFFIDYNLNLIDKYKNSTPKAYAKISALSNYNVALIYYWFDNFDTCEHYISEGLKSGELKSDFEKLRKNIEKAKESLVKNKKKYRSER
ncbi:MAG: hypothetical protein LBR26_12775 [Prevotella sp.]|jgi:hypothetical protein|nr:hypothetical protein [Prevotella sp.]